MTLSLVHAPATVLARQTIEHHSKSFALASRLLAERERDQTVILYAWCRNVDDAIDSSPPEDARSALVSLRQRLDATYRGEMREPLHAALTETLHARRIPLLYPAELLFGMEMDVTQSVYSSMDELFLYAYRVAGVVGLMMSHVFGVRSDAALVHAAHLGIAMQLTNICRDVAEDWDRGRLYLPAELLARHGAASLATDLGSPLPKAARPAIARTVAELLALADRYYVSGARGERALPWRAALGVRAARGVYSAIGLEIAARQHDVTAGRAVVSRGTKLARVAKALAHTVIELPIRAFGAKPAIPTLTLEARDVTRL